MSQAKNERLHDALRAYTLRAIEVLIQLGADTRIPSIPSPTWVRQSNDIFIPISATRPLWFAIAVPFLPQLNELAEYKCSLEILKTDNHFSTQIDTLVGSTLGAMRQEASSLINQPLLKMAESLSKIAFDDSVFMREYRHLEDSLYADFIEYERITPLPGFASDKSNIWLTSDVSIAELSDDEALRLLQSGLQIGTTIHPMQIVVNPAKFAIRVRFRLRKLKGDAEFEANKPVTSDIPHIRGETEVSVIQILRTFKAGTIKPAGTLMHALNAMQGMGTLSNSPQQRILPNAYSLSYAEAEEFARFYAFAMSKNVQARTSLETAIRRLSYATEREVDEDKILDLLIAAEALLLSEGSDWHGEITYRISHRAAMFLADTPAAQADLFHFFRGAYEARSKIVHGSKSPRLPIRQGVTRYTFPEFLSRLEELIRLGVKRSVALASQVDPDTSLVDWSKLMFK